MSNIQAITISKNTYLLQGTVVDKESKGVQGLRVEVIDKDSIGQSDHLGSDVTDAAGMFEVSFKKSDFTELFIDHKPDLLFKVFKGDKLLLDTKDNIIANADEKTSPIVLKVDVAKEGDDADTNIIFHKIEDVAQYKGANWDNEIHRAKGISLEEAKDFAMSNPEVTYFFYMKGSMFLEGKEGKKGWTEKGQFNPGDAVFFSGRPWYGTAKQADVYEKREVSFEEKPNKAQYKGADWANELFRMTNITTEEAKQIALNHPEIDFFFRTHATMWLEGKVGPGGWEEKGHFHNGDVVFFSGKPWYGNAPQSTAYEKTVVPLYKK